MSSRSDSNATRLHRSKSATSVKDRRRHPLSSDPPDPETSRVHALIAAHRAMDRSKSHSSGDMRRTDSKASARTNHTAKQSQIRFSPGTQLRRQRSLLQERAPHLAQKLSNPPRSEYNNTESTASEFGARSENYGAEPSSYRRVRRTKSLLTPRRRLFSDTTSPRSPFSQAPTLRTAASSNTLAQPSLGLRFKKSLYALRPSGRFSLSRRPETHVTVHDEAVQLARAQYLDDVQEQKVSKKPSLLFHPKVRREQKAFRQSLRSSHLRDTDSSLGSSQVLDASNAEGKRTFSATLRDRFKRAFGKSVNDSVSMPTQHVHATRQHFSDNSSRPTNSFDEYQLDQEGGRRASFYVASGPDVDSQEELDRFSPDMQTSASRESLQSNAKSRVTSWTNSSATDSTVRGPSVGGMAGNRLSIIKEDGGVHQPSSSIGRHIGGISTFHEPLLMEDHRGQPVQRPDSQRIYSALMKRIGEDEAEMDETEAALGEIKAGNEQQSARLDGGQSTIRAVSSTTLGSVTAEEDRRQRDDNPWQNEHSSGMTPSQHKQNVERRQQKRALVEEQSSFFPFSDENKPSTTSPFRKLLEERRSQGRSDEISAAEKVEEELHPEPARPASRGRRGMSSESVYSRMSNMEYNPDYVPPAGSEDRLAPAIEESDDEPGMATIIPARYRPSTATRPKLPSAAGSSDREFKGWVEGQVASLGRRGSQTGSHVREHAQIDPDDVEIGKRRSRPTSRTSMNQAYPLLELKRVPSNKPSAPKRNPAMTKSQSGLLNKQSTDGLDAMVEHHNESHKFGNGLRKITPANIAKMLKDRKSQMFTSNLDDVGKENKPASENDSPPISTPGRLHLQMRSGNGRLRKRASDVVMKTKENHSIISKNVSTPLQLKRNPDGESPTDRVKASLSARLSRPFNMDVPEYNRPFDSMYLGKGEADQFGCERLSVAPHANTRVSKGYGGLGPNPFDGDKDTALPHVSTPSPASAKMAGLWSSKRMVSDFLRNRRERTASRKTEEGSPAFI